MGRPHTPEEKAAISAAMRGVVRTPETRRRMSEAQIGHSHTAESRAKMSASAKARWARLRAAQGTE